MKYMKPEIAVLGDAKRVIEVFQKGDPNYLDTDGFTRDVQQISPAYDLDE